MSTVGMALFLLVFYAVGFGMLGYGVHSLMMAREAAAWPTTEGRIEACELVESSDSDGGSTYVVETAYRYRVAGRSYRGERIAFGYSASSGREAHQEIAERLAAAKTVLVRYDPANPERAVLSHGLNRSTLFLLIFATTWLLFVTGFTLLAVTSSMSDIGLLATLVILE